MNKDEITFLGSCSICAAVYEKKRISIVEKNEDVLTVHVDCPKCLSSALLSVYSGIRGLVTTVGIPTDLTKADLERVKRSRRISSDDVLELHNFLERKETKRKK